jgi:hypothetical protein
MEHSFNNQRKLKVTNILSTAINQHTPPIVSTGSTAWMNYMYTLWLGAKNVPKTMRPFQKRGCWKSDIKEVHKLKHRHSLDVLAHMI